MGYNGPWRKNHDPEKCLEEPLKHPGGKRYAKLRVLKMVSRQVCGHPAGKRATIWARAQGKCTVELPHL